MASSKSHTAGDNAFPSISNQGYFSDYFFAYRLNAGLSDLYKRWDEAEKVGHPTPRTRVKSLSTAFDKYRVDAVKTSPDEGEDEGALDLGLLHEDSVQAVRDLNHEVLNSLGWTPERGQLELISGEKAIQVPHAHHAETPSGTLLLSLETVFTSDPATVVADKKAPAGTLLDPITIGDKVEGRTVLEAAQLIFTADDPPSYLLICSGGGLTLLDRERWVEGVFLGVDLDDAVARGDAKAKGELAAVAALFSADSINPGEEAQSVLDDLQERAKAESAGVSKELRHGVRRSVELLANAVVDDIRNRQKGKWLDIDPDDLTRQCLRYLYRIIVLLYAEARPELGILPTDDPDYQTGYSLARLREVALTDLHSPHAKNGDHLQTSLALLFSLVNTGYEPPSTLDTDARGLTFPGLGSSLFSEQACPMLDRAKISDETMQQVLANLVFSQEQAGKQKQALSYATLGINQLGAVYEGLMAYRGFLATEELYELDDDGDPDTGTWVIPVADADEFNDEVFLKKEGADGVERRIRYREGDFVFRLSGRDRQRSASYYTPEVLTEFTVRHALEVYWEENPGMTAEDILSLTVCEPALGSGAFLNEAINQLAERYLKATQNESSETVDPDQYQLELQRVKAHFALNQAYGVDLNKTAVELAEVSLWLNCMHRGLEAPDFSARLRRGNSLIGARRATYTADQVKGQPWKGGKKNPIRPPKDQPFNKVGFGEVTGIHHFLLPGEGWGSAANATELKGKGGKKPVKGLAEDWADAVREWKKSIHKKPSDSQLRRLRALANRVEAAWAKAAEHASEHQAARSRSIDFWGSKPDTVAQSGNSSGKAFLDPEGPASRLRLLMDAWCALWMWAPANGTALPDLDGWLHAVELLLGQSTSEERESLFTSYELDERTLESVEVFGKATVGEVTERHPWLVECQRIADRQAFFHWELEYPHIFSSGGFDLQVGNPPWVRPTWDESASLAEQDPWWGVTDLGKTANSIKKERRDRSLEIPGAANEYQKDLAENIGLNSLLAATSREPLLRGVQTNLYMAFITNTWRRSGSGGVVGLLHPESHYVDPGAGQLRSASYRRLRRHWQFANEMFLFEDVHHVTEFGVNLYSGSREPSFVQAVNLLVPATLDRSLDHDRSGEPPGIQYPEGGWDLRPHKERIVHVDRTVLSDWVLLFDDADTPSDEARLFRPLTARELLSMRQFARIPRRLGGTDRHWTRGFDEDKLKETGTGVWRTGTPRSLEDCLLQGPHIVNATPFAQQPKEEYRNNTDWEPVDITTIEPNFIPRTNYQRAVPAKEFVKRQPRWKEHPISSRYRSAHREFVGSGSVRTLQACLLPPGVANVGTIVTTTCSDDYSTAVWSGLLSSLPYDYLVKVSGVGHIKQYLTDALPIPDADPLLTSAAVLRVLRLNCVLSAYSDLWSRLYLPEWTSDRFVAGSVAVEALESVDPTWSVTTPLRQESDRWQALCELDAIVAHMLGVSADQLIQMYRSQFAVLRKYETQMVFDGNGRRICGDYHAFGFMQTEWEQALKERPSKPGQRKMKMWDRVQAFLDGETSIDLGPFVPPFRHADRESAMRNAYQAFSERLEAADR